MARLATFPPFFRLPFTFNFYSWLFFQTLVSILLSSPFPLLFSFRSVRLAISRIPQETLADLLDGEVILEAEGGVAAVPATGDAAAEEGEEAEGEAEDAAAAEVGVFGEGHADVEEDLLDGRDRELGLDFWW